jgi:diguanylate cyclase
MLRLCSQETVEAAGHGRMQGTNGGGERTFLIGQKAIELMKAYGSSAHPKSYELWYTYVSGHKPLMNDAVKRIILERGALSDPEVESLYDGHLSAQRFPTRPNRRARTCWARSIRSWR